jgi:SMODS-associated and fused to various effectors sensor domain
VSLPARAAAIRGDDYQHAVGWVAACQALCDPDIQSVSIEDADGGHFDDVVTRRRTGRDTYIQVKSSNSGDVVVDDNWLLTPAAKAGKSPLQHFHATWHDLTLAGRPFDLILLTNRGFDHEHPILGPLRDLQTNRIRVNELRARAPRSKAGQARRRWAEHLAVSQDELLEFLAQVTWRHGDSEPDWDERARPLMHQAGLRTDGEAITSGKALIRSWVTSGAGPQRRDDIRRQVADRSLLARSGTLTLAVHAIDHQPDAAPANVELDFTALFDGETAFARRQLKDPAGWREIIAPELAQAARALEAYGPRRVHVRGSMRLPLWFATGRELPDVRQWVLSLDQHGQEWRTSPAEDVTPRVLAQAEVGQGSDLALAIALTHDPTADVRAYIRAATLPVGSLLVLGPDGEPGPQSVSCGPWAAGWARAARDQARRAASLAGARRIHLFIAAPQAVALMLGHHWNLTPPTIVYEHTPPDYAPTITVS